MNVPIELVLGAHDSIMEQLAMSRATLAGVNHHDVLGEGASVRATERYTQCASAQRHTAAPIQAGPTETGLVTAWALAAGIAEPHWLLHFVCPQALLAFLKKNKRTSTKGK